MGQLHELVWMLSFSFFSPSISLTSAIVKRWLIPHCPAARLSFPITIAIPSFLHTHTPSFPDYSHCHTIFPHPSHLPVLPHAPKTARQARVPDTIVCGIQHRAISYRHPRQHRVVGSVQRPLKRVQSVVR